VERFRLHCHLFWVDVRVRRFGGRWLASADTPDGPTIGMGTTKLEAVHQALDDFDDVRTELLRDVRSGA
jgi:hypothetical protein